MTNSSISLISTSGVPSEGIARANSEHLDYALFCIDRIHGAMTCEQGPLDPKEASGLLKKTVKTFKSDIKKDSHSYIDDFDRHALEIQHQKVHKREYQKLTETIEKVKAQFPTIEIDEIQKEIDNEQASLDITISSLASNAFERFYSATLDSRPNLDPHLKGGFLDEELYYMNADLKNFLQEHGDDIDPNYKTTLTEFTDQLHRASTWARSSGSGKTVKEILAKIYTLKPGQSCLIPGGSKAHAFVYKVVLLSEDKISFTIINTGSDESIFKMIHRIDILESDFTYRKGIHYTDKSYTLNIAALDSSFIQAISREDNENIPAAKVIAKVDQLLADRKAVAVNGRSHAPQLRGSCSVKCVTSWLKDELMRVHGTAGRAVYEQFRAYRTQKNISAISRVQQEAGEDVLHKVYREPNPQKLETRLNTMHVEARRISRKRARKAAQLNQEQTRPHKLSAEIASFDSTLHLEMGLY